MTENRKNRRGVREDYNDEGKVRLSVWMPAAQGVSRVPWRAWKKRVPFAVPGSVRLDGVLPCRRKALCHFVRAIALLVFSCTPFPLP